MSRHAIINATYGNTVAHRTAVHILWTYISELMLIRVGAEVFGEYASKTHGKSNYTHTMNWTNWKCQCECAFYASRFVTCLGNVQTNQCSLNMLFMNNLFKFELNQVIQYVVIHVRQVSHFLGSHHYGDLSPNFNIT